jgi:cyclase
MLKRRLVAILYLRDGWIVRSENFSIHQVIGNPVPHVERMVQWDVDELVVLDISRGEACYNIGRDDYRHRGALDLRDFIRRISAECRIPLTFGGRIRSFEDARRRIVSGADKVTLNTALADQPTLLMEVAHAFGSQAAVASIDYRLVNGSPRVFVDGGERDLQVEAMAWAHRAEDQGAGEILLNSIDRDGSARGFDIETIQRVVEAVSIPVIACGGAGHIRHFNACLSDTEVSAVAAGNIFHFTENAYPRTKKYLAARRQDIRYEESPVE